MRTDTLPGPPTARARRRRADLQHREQQGAKQQQRRDRRRSAFQTMRRRAQIVRDYRARRRTADTEAEAAEGCAERFDCGKRTLRRYHRRWRGGGKRTLLPRYQQKPPRARLTLSAAATQVALALRARLAWCGQRIAEELRLRGLAEVSHTTLYRLFRRYHVPRRTYHPAGGRDGIRFRRQRVKAPNWTWQIDFAGPLDDADGQRR